VTPIEWILIVSIAVNCGLCYKIYTTHETIKKVIALLTKLESLSEKTSSGVKKLKTTGGEK